MSTAKKSASRRNLDALFKEAKSRPSQIGECGSYKVLFSTIARYAGFTLVADSVFHEYGPKYDIRRHSITGKFSAFSIDMIYKEHTIGTSLLTASQAITEILKKEE